MSEQKQQPHPLASLGGVAGAIGGFALSRYSGPSFWIPGGVLFLLLLLFTKTPLGPKHFTGAIATTLAHVTWFALAVAVVGIQSAILIDIAALIVAVLWLWASPGLLSVLFLGFIQLASLAFNVTSLLAATYGDQAHKALVVHCALRLTTIACLIYGYIRLRRERATPPAIPSFVNH